ncbi:MAG: universal stress protein [Microcoleus vaginatus WJT46-NPBG5]|jgi:nucleotide-binding universal stress UspA family protein|nr:universal stress protein [Microcoleus vaginatus WJT46-NPBG5]
MSFQKILVALDDSQLSKVVFNRALEMAQATHARMMLFHCLIQEMIGESLAVLPVELGLYPELMDNAYQAEHLRVEQRIEQVQGMLAEYCKTATALEVPTEFDYKIGDAGECLCQAAKNWGSDVIVLGRRGRTGWAEALLGSVSNYVVHRAPCSVLVIQQVEILESMVL